VPGGFRRLTARTRLALTELKLLLVPPKERHHFVIVSAVRDMEQFIRRHIDSVFAQDYPKDRYRHLIVDDASTDATSDLIESFIGDNPGCNVEHRTNAARLGGCANLARAFRSAPPQSIVIQLDGDDWLPNRRVLSFLNLVYQDPEVWMTYNTWTFPDGRKALNCERIPERVIESASYREEPWISSHLHSFRAALFAHVKDESLIDPETGEPWSSAVDMAQYFPMLELAGRHARHIERPLYVYNFHSGSIQNQAPERQKACEMRIRGLKRYSALDALA
jgi:glycosyltransferase involved in cell wall biosynthesis